VCPVTRVQYFHVRDMKSVIIELNLGQVAKLSQLILQCFQVKRHFLSRFGVTSNKG